MTVIERQKVVVLLSQLTVPTRRFGFWQHPDASHLPVPIARHQPLRDERHGSAHVLALTEMEQYAGVIEYKGQSYCRICEAGKVHPVRGNGNKEYVFQPKTGGAIYRWPEGLVHYFTHHNVEPPEWLAVMIKDFEEAKKMGQWS